MNIQLKGDISGLSQKQLDVIKNVIKDQKFEENSDITIESFGQAGDNFASDLRVIKIRNENEVISIVAKITQNFSRSLNEVNIISHSCFNNEIIMYTELLPMMVNLQESARVSASDYLQYATCYGTSNESAHEIILLEDLTKKNYVMLDKFKPLSSDTVKLILKTLAQYHSLSYVLKDKSPDIFAEFCENIVNFTTLEETQKHAENFKALGELFSQVFDSDFFKNIIIDTLDKQMDRQLKLVKSDKGSKYSVIIHGDCWSNNFLFQLQDDQPTKCIMIDYQMVGESPPVVDILHLIFNGTEYETRSKHYYEWLDYYHSELANYLFEHGLKINNVYPKDKFYSNLKQYSKTCLGMAIFTASIMFRKNEEATKMKEAFSDSENMSDMLNTFDLSELNKDSILKIKNRIEEVINSFIDFGYLDGKNLV